MSNSNSSVNEQFTASVLVSMDSVGSDGMFDGSVRQEAQCKMFVDVRQKETPIVGGDPLLNGWLSADPSHYDHFTYWTKVESS